MKKIFITIFAIFSFCSCATVDGLLPKMQEINIPTVSEKKDISFSLDWECNVFSDMCWEETPNKTLFAEIIQQKLAETGMFGRIRQTSFKDKSDYHLEFKVNFPERNIFDNSAAIALGLFVLYIPPTQMSSVDADFSMRLFVENREMYAVAATEHQEKWVSISPFSLIALAFSKNAEEDSIFKKAMDYFIYEIAENKIYDKNYYMRTKKALELSEKSELQKDEEIKESTVSTTNTRKTVSTSDGLKAYTPKGLAELDKDSYVKKAREILSEEHSNGILEVPSCGLLFKVGSSNLLSYYNEMLDSFIELYLETDGKSKVIVEGYSSNAANETGKNPQLSEQRAKAVADYLIKKEIPSESIEIKAYGNEKTNSGMFAKDPNCKGGQCYRRVNVSIK